MVEPGTIFELCAWCDKQIKPGEPWAGYGPGDNFHVGCLKAMGASDVVVIPEKAKHGKGDRK